MITPFEKKRKKKKKDRISIELLHKKALLFSLEQQRCKQLLALMYKISKK